MIAHRTLHGDEGDPESEQAATDTAPAVHPALPYGTLDTFDTPDTPDTLRELWARAVPPPRPIPPASVRLHKDSPLGRCGH